MMATRKLLGLVALGALTVAAMFFNSPPAHADTVAEVAYIDSLSALGFEVYDRPTAIQTGYWICDQMPSVNSDDIAQYMFRTADRNDIPSIEWAQTWVVVAGMNLCPWEFHPTHSIGV